MPTKCNIKAVNKVQCKTCIFRPDSTLVSPTRMAEIQQYLIQGTNHICHVTDKICRGGRDYQLPILHRLGFIKAPTDEALYEANDNYLKNK